MRVFELKIRDNHVYMPEVLPSRKNVIIFLLFQGISSIDFFHFSFSFSLLFLLFFIFFLDSRQSAYILEGPFDPLLYCNKSQDHRKVPSALCHCRVAPFDDLDIHPYSMTESWVYLRNRFSDTFPSVPSGGV